MLKNYLKFYLYNLGNLIHNTTCPILGLNRNITPQYGYSRSISNKSSSMEEVNTFIGKKDRYGGVIVNSSDEPLQSENSDFGSILKHSLAKWTAQGVRGVWFVVTLQHANWLPDLAKNGFVFHHGEGNEVTMYRWLPTTEPCGIPRYSHTMVGIGGIVINSRNELLVVMEQNPVVKRWKLPGGYVEPGESLAEAVVREIQEETGVQTKFESMVAFRHILKFVFGCADLYFVAELTPISDTIVKDDHEIEKCTWMKIEDFLSDPDASPHNKKFVKNYLKCKETGIKMKMNESVHDILKNRQLWFTLENENLPKDEDS